VRRTAIHLGASLAGAVAVGLCVFLPWVRIGDVALAGIPDPAGLFVLALGVGCVIVTLVSWALRRQLPFVVMLAGVAVLTTLSVVWRTAPRSVAERAQARAQAVALVDNVPLQPVPPVRVGAGVYVGMAGGVVLLLAGLSDRNRVTNDPGTVRQLQRNGPG
jgi:hypothetical protein